MTDLTLLAALPPKPRRVSRKCSTCADRRCRQRGRVCDWKNCGNWKGEEKSGGK